MSGKTKAEVLAKIKKLTTVRDEGAGTSPARPMTLDEWGTRWFTILDDEVTMGALEASTRDSYQDTWRLHVAPELGGWRLDELTPGLCQAWLARKAKEDAVRGGPHRVGAAKGHVSKKVLYKRLARAMQQVVSPPPPPSKRSHASLRYMRNVVRRSLADAVRHSAIPTNPASSCKVPGGKRQSKKIQGHTKAEMKLLWPAMHTDELSALWLALFMLSLRIGEILALRWATIDLDAGTLIVKRNARRQKTEEGAPKKTEVVESDTKAHRERPMAIPRLLLVVLRRHCEEQAAKRSAFNAMMADLGSSLLWADDDLVFTTDIGTRLDGANVRAFWKELALSCGVPNATPHRLRHTGATLLVRSGLPLDFAREWLGHADVRTTRNYLDENLDQVAAAAGAMDAYAEALEDPEEK